MKNVAATACEAQTQTRRHRNWHIDTSK